MTLYMLQKKHAAISDPGPAGKDGVTLPADACDNAAPHSDEQPALILLKNPQEDIDALITKLQSLTPDNTSDIRAVFTEALITPFLDELDVAQTSNGGKYLGLMEAVILSAMKKLPHHIQPLLSAFTCTARECILRQKPIHLEALFSQPSNKRHFTKMMINKNYQTDQNCAYQLVDFCFNQILNSPETHTTDRLASLLSLLFQHGADPSRPHPEDGTDCSGKTPEQLVREYLPGNLDLIAIVSKNNN